MPRRPSRGRRSTRTRCLRLLQLTAVGLRLTLGAPRRVRDRFQALDRDRPVAILASSVDPLLDPIERAVDLAEDPARLLGQAEVLGLLEVLGSQICEMRRCRAASDALRIVPDRLSVEPAHAVEMALPFFQEPALEVPNLPGVERGSGLDHRCVPHWGRPRTGRPRYEAGYTFIRTQKLRTAAM